MLGVELGPERLDLASSRFQWTSDNGLWWGLVPYQHQQIEIYLAGSENGPDAQWLSLAERVCAQIEPFVAEGISYLRAFIDKNHFPCDDGWSLEGLEFGRDMHERLRWPFELMFVLDGDTYGMWGVLFADSGDPFGYMPCQFRRYQC